MIVNERDTPKGLLVSVCDRDVLGETFVNGEVSLTVDPDFYDGERVEADRVVESLAKAQVANLVGVEVVDLAIEHGFVDPAQVLEIEDTKHAQFLRM